MLIFIKINTRKIIWTLIKVVLLGGMGQVMEDIGMVMGLSLKIVCIILTSMTEILHSHKIKLNNNNKKTANLRVENKFGQRHLTAHLTLFSDISDVVL